MDMERRMSDRVEMERRMSDRVEIERRMSDRDIISGERTKGKNPIHSTSHLGHSTIHSTSPLENEPAPSNFPLNSLLGTLGTGHFDLGRCLDAASELLRDQKGVKECLVLTASISIDSSLSHWHWKDKNDKRDKKESVTKGSDRDKKESDRDNPNPPNNPNPPSNKPSNNPRWGMKVHIGSFSGEPAIFKKVSRATGGNFVVFSGPGTFLDSLKIFLFPSPFNLPRTDLVSFGLPKLSPSLLACNCHGILQKNSFSCPFCTAIVCKLPTICPVCNSQLISEHEILKARHYLSEPPVLIRKDERKGSVSESGWKGESEKTGKSDNGLVMGNCVNSPLSPSPSHSHSPSKCFVCKLPDCPYSCSVCRVHYCSECSKKIVNDLRFCVGCKWK